jgi:hypothetical protein
MAPYPSAAAVTNVGYFCWQQAIIAAHRLDSGPDCKFTDIISHIAADLFLTAPVTGAVHLTQSGLVEGLGKAGAEEALAAGESAAFWTDAILGGIEVAGLVIVIAVVCP